MQSSKGKWIRNMLIVVLIPTVIFILLLIAYPQNISLVNVPKLLSQAIAPAILAWESVSAWLAGTGTSR